MAKTGLSLGGTHQKTNWDIGAAGSAQSNNLSNAFYFARRIAPIYPVHLHYTEDVFASDGSLLHSKGDYILNEEGGNNMMTVRKAVRNRMPPAMDAIYCGKAKRTSCGTLPIPCKEMPMWTFLSYAILHSH